MAAQLVQGQGEQRGGARPNSGPDGNGQTHSANVQKTNIRIVLRQIACLVIIWHN